ncbi:MAG: response regulator [Candidatus Latescibacteria bacterium]|nr:response regulator [Candidatus Latescibacterota bacterium]
MRRKTVITTGDVAEHCQVSYETVKNWIRQGKLPAFETPGGHHRIVIENFKSFLESYGMPAYQQGPTVDPAPPTDGKKRILMIDEDSSLLNKVVDFLSKSGEYEFATASNGFDAGMHVAALKPDLLILDFLTPGLNGFDICRTIKTSPHTRGTLVLATTDHPEGGNMSGIYECGADDGLIKPFELEELQSRVSKLFSSPSKAGSSSQRA